LNKELKVVGAPTCIQCQVLQNFLEGMGVDYTYISLSDETDEARWGIKAMAKNSARSLPAVFIDEEYIGSLHEGIAYARDLGGN